VGLCDPRRGFRTSHLSVRVVASRVGVPPVALCGPERPLQLERGLSTLQFQSVSVTRSIIHSVQGGTQDNGTLIVYWFDDMEQEIYAMAVSRDSTFPPALTVQLVHGNFYYMTSRRYPTKVGHRPAVRSLQANLVSAVLRPNH